jgi:2-polyprenyl-6-methoxyphenol hydroxylase-like FAD-dependent oxidoreductase
LQQHPRIAIVGGGPAALTAAVILHRHGWPFTIYETDASADARDQGGTLDLHPDDGQLALHKAGLLDAFLAIARHDDQGERVLDHATADVLHEEVPAPGSGQRPEIDRVVLRRLLLAAIDDRSVRWGSRVLGVVDLPSGEYGLRLSDRTDGPFDLVIGADGAWSRVRPMLTDEVPVYTGVTFVELWLADVDVRHAASAALVGHGTMFALHDGAGIIAQRNGGGMIRVYAAFRTEPEAGDRPDIAYAGITTNALLDRFEGWAPQLRMLLADADRIAAVRPIVALPPGMRWPHRAGVVLVGDAAHVMPPLGVGVNLAMLDAAELAEALVTSNVWPDAVKQWEDSMLARAAETATQCHEGFAEMFSTGASDVVLDHMAERTAGCRTVDLASRGDR